MKDALGRNRTDRALADDTVGPADLTASKHLKLPGKLDPIYRAYVPSGEQQSGVGRTYINDSPHHKLAWVFASVCSSVVCWPFSIVGGIKSYSVLTLIKTLPVSS